MSTILYTLKDGEPVKEIVEACKVNGLLKAGYAVTPEQLIKRDEVDTNDSGKISDKEVKEAARKAGIAIGRKSIKTLKEELGI